jgi:amidohydrolase
VPDVLTWQQQVDEEVDACFPQVVQLRRHLHAHPEPSGSEFQTSLHLYQLLGDMGLEVRLGPDGCGVLADLASGPAQRNHLALRADIDALRINDLKTVPYRSTCPNVMHACGHDAHTAIVWGALACIWRLQQQDRLPWVVRLRGIFQPAEETAQGARQMIEAGALEGTAAILATHVDPTRYAGRVGLRRGVMTANCDEMQFAIRGRGGHAARPHETRDPIAAAAQLINALYLQLPRLNDSQDAVVVTIGRITGGDNSNVIPERVDLHGTLRTLSQGVRQEAIAQIRHVAAGMAETTRTVIDVLFGAGAPNVDNDPGLVDLLSDVCRESVGPDRIETIDRASMGSEDFAFYLQHVPGAMFRLGVRTRGQGIRGLHTPEFDIDEEAMRSGVRIMARAAISWFDGRWHGNEPDARVVPQ